MQDYCVTLKYFLKKIENVLGNIKNQSLETKISDDFHGEKHKGYANKTKNKRGKKSIRSTSGTHVYIAFSE